MSFSTKYSAKKDFFNEFKKLPCKKSFIIKYSTKNYYFQPILHQIREKSLLILQKGPSKASIKYSNGKINSRKALKCENSRSNTSKPPPVKKIIPTTKKEN